MKRPNPHEERQRQLDKARDAFLRAAAVLTNSTRNEKDALASAILEGAYGLHLVVGADADKFEGTEKALAYLRGVAEAA